MILPEINQLARELRSKKDAVDSAIVREYAGKTMEDADSFAIEVEASYIPIQMRSVINRGDMTMAEVRPCESGVRFVAFC